MRNIHVVSHTHWDREWYRPFQSFRLKLVHLVDELLDLLESDPQFKFFMLDGQTIVLEDYLALRPEKEAILRRHIRKGRILIGPWHILPDMFLVGPEAHIRNLLQGDRTARKFGPKMMVGYIPDPFGHPGQIPQLLRGFNIETACVWRGLDDQPAEFIWQAPDGSQVLMAYLRDGYSNGASLPADNLPAFAEALKSASDALSACSSVPDTLIMFGTDHMEPPPNTSKAIAYANQALQDTHVLHSTLPEFIAALQSDIKSQKLDLPLIVGELRACKRMHLLPGVLSTRMWIKQRNHASESLLVKWAEPFSLWQEFATPVQSAILNQKSEILHQAWVLLMQNHPHDSICGCSIDQVHDEMKVRFDQVDQIGEELLRQSLETIAANVPTDAPLGESAILVFNPSSWPRRDVVKSTLELPPAVDEFELVDENGHSLPYQRLGLGSREIVNVVMDAQGLQSAFGFINDGRVSGMAIQDIQIRRTGPLVLIQAVMLEDGEPNLAAWVTGRKQVDEFMQDPSITEYHVVARSPATTQIIFCSPEVPGLGYRPFWVRSVAGNKKAALKLNWWTKLLLPLARLPLLQKLATRPPSSRPPHRIENEFFVVELEQAGTLSLMDKRSGLIYKGLNAFLDGADRGDEYNYAPPAQDEFRSAHLKEVRLETGQVQQSLHIKLELVTSACLGAQRSSRSKRQVTLPITTIVTLMNGLPRLDIHTTIDNRARDHRLRVHFPAPFVADVSFQDGHFEVVERKVGLPDFDESWIEQPRPEVPQRAFTDITDGRNGLMIANRGLPEVEVLNNASGNAEIAITLLRCVGWLSRDDFSTRNGHAGPFMETPAAQVPGVWSYDYSIIPHAGDWRSAFTQAYAFETPLRSASTGIHPGSLPVSASFLEVRPASFVVSAVKQSEDGRDWLVRGYNVTAEPIELTIKPWKSFEKVELINLAEEKQSILKPIRDGSLILPVRGHEIISLCFRA